MFAQQVKSIPHPSAVFRPDSYIERLDLSKLFPVANPLEVELGAGDGSFLAQWAKLHPDRNFLGVERLLGRLRKIDRKASRIGLANLRLMRMEASYFTEYLLPLASVSALHIYFPDPWPKRKHRKNRLIQAEFAAAVAKALVPQGVVYLRTDDSDYFAQMKNVFNSLQSFREVPTPADLQNVITDFERGFAAKGVATLRAAYMKV